MKYLGRTLAVLLLVAAAMGFTCYQLSSEPALHAAAILGLSDAGVKKRLNAWRAKLTRSVARKPK